jgi:spermidine/putrescine-binding protein
LWPAKSEGSTTHGAISNDTMTVLKGSEHPVLAHQFINFMLDEANALLNFEFVGYQPPQNGLSADYLVSEEWLLPHLAPALVVPGDFELDSAWVQGPLSAATEALWVEQWNRAQSGG